MSRKPTLASEESVARLKQTIIRKSGLACANFADVQLLQHKVKRDTGEYLSIQTLNRFFGLIKNDFRPSMATLNILSTYVGYTSFVDFEIMQSAAQGNGQTRSFAARLIIAMFSDVKPVDYHEVGLLDVLKNIAQMLEKDASLNQEIYPFMAASDFGRRYFFEQFVNIDALASHYGEGMNFYLMHADNREQQFFGYCMLALRNFLTGEHSRFNYYYSKLLSYPKSEISAFHPFLIGRFYATQVYNCLLSHGPVDMLDEAIEAFRALDARADQENSYPYAQYIFAEALVLAEEWHYAYELLKESSWRLRFSPAYMQEGYVAQYQFLQLYAGHQAGRLRQDRATEELNRISQVPFCLQSEDFYGILLLKLWKEMLPDEFTMAHEAKLQQLICKTQFSFFNRPTANELVEELLLMENKGKKIG